MGVVSDAGAQPAGGRGPDATEPLWTGPPHYPPPRLPRPVNQGFGTTPFARLARTHFASVVGDASFVIGMASSVFFSVDFDAARWRVGLFLLLTLVPFAVVAPLLGPAIDRARGGRRLMLIASCTVRALLAGLLVRDLESNWFYLEAFGMLVMGKTYHVAKSALVPTTVRSDEELVEANSKLALLSGIGGAVAAAPAGLLSLAGPQWVIAFSAVVFAIAAALSLRVSKAPIAEVPADEQEKLELRGIGIRRAAETMSFLRAIVGFLAFLLAFQFKDEGVALGMALVGAQGGVLLGAALAPRLREQTTEERIVTWSTGAVAAASFICFLGLHGPVGAAFLSLVVGAGAGAAKQSFDAIVQRDAPDANFGRSFARFESRFQLFWCLGALVPVAFAPPLTAGFLVISVTATAAVTRYVIGARRAQEEHEHRLQMFAVEGASEAAPPRPKGFERVRSIGRRRRGEPEAAVPAPVNLTKFTPPSDEDVAADPTLGSDTAQLLERLEFRPVRPPPEPDPDDDLAFPTDTWLVAPSPDRPAATQPAATQPASTQPAAAPAPPGDARLPGFDDDPTLTGEDPTAVIPRSSTP